MTQSTALGRFRALISEHLGLEFEDSKLPFLAEVLEQRSRATRLSVEAYLEGLTEANGEISELARELSVSETYFLRNPAHFEAFARLLRARGPNQPLRVLSAGCCSGEEAYSLAIVVHDTLGAIRPGSVTILGVDADPAAIGRAREATYSSWSLRQTPEAVQARHFTPAAGKCFRLKEPLRRLVCFEQRNLVRPDSGFWRPGAFDIIFCRNVLMYFTEEARRAAVGRMAEALTPGGYLFLGHAETLRGVSNAFHLEHECDTFFYRRRDALARPSRPEPSASVSPVVLAPQPLDTTWLETIGSASARIAALASEPGGARSQAVKVGLPRSDLTASMDLLRRERYAEALESLGAEPVDESQDALLLRAVLLTHRGDLEGARATCRKLLALDELSAGAHYVMALCCEHGDDLPSAREHDQTACYLEPEFAMPHLHLGLMARRRGDLAAAQRELQRALGLLLREDATRIVLFGGGFSRDALVRLCQTELSACARGMP